MSDIRIFVIVGLCLSGVIVAIFQAPPLTARETAVAAAVDQDRFEAIFDSEVAHCEGLSDDIDCQCYGQISGVVQSSDPIPDVAGVRRVDREYLARMQASDRC